jgi:acetyltransferase-like isoleucine patch superfamily enzyme
MAQYKRKKPTPKTQSELAREQIQAYDATRGTVPASTKLNRENQLSLKDDTVKLPVVSLKDIDEAIVYYFKNIIKPSVVQNGSKLDVPILYGSPERWAAVQKDGFYRDKDGKLQVPLIMFRKSNIEKNRSLGNKLDGNEVSNFVIYEKKYSKRNIYDRFSLISNRQPSKELYGVVIPDYVTVTYQCIIYTDYVEQCDKLIEALNFASDSYWGDKERYRFRARIDSYTPTIEMAQGSDRAVKATFNLVLHGYIITDTYNRDKANLKKFYSKAQVNFGFETVGDLETLTAASRTPQEAAPARFFDSQIGAFQPPPGTGGMTGAEITFISLNTTAIADTVISNKATFNNRTIATAPSGFTIDESSFQVYVNGILIPSTQRTTSQVGANIEVFFDTNAIQYEMLPDFEVILAGKFT